MGSALCVAGIVNVVEVQALCFFFAGLATSTLFVTSSSAVQLLAPPERKSAILGLFSIVTIGVQPLAAMGGRGGFPGSPSDDYHGRRAGSPVLHLDAQRAFLAQFQVYPG